MRIPLAFIAALTVAFITNLSGARAADALAGKMTPFGYLLGGSWNCSTKVPAMGNQPARTDQGTATFDVVPGNVVHNHVSTPTYSGDFYFGYSDRASSYWQTEADNMGVHGFLTSTDGITYTGTSAMGPTATQDTVTYTKVTPSRVTVHEVLLGLGPQGVFDSVCTR